MPRLHLSCERQGIAKQGCAAEKCDFPCATVYRKSRNFTLFPKAVDMRQIECAFSGYARGRFLTKPCRALLVSASAPPPYSRKSRCAAIFREIFGFIFYKNHFSAPLFANTFAFAGKVNAARVVWCALERRAAEENSDGQAALPRAVGFSYKSRRFAGDSSPRNART